MIRTAVIAAAMLLTTHLAPGHAQAAGKRVQINGMQMYYEVSGAGRSNNRAARRVHEHPQHGRDHPEARQDSPGLRG